MTACRVRFSEDASADLHQIELYIASQASLPVARRFTDALIRRCEALRDFPKRGRPREDLGPNIRSISHRGRVLVVYRLTGRDAEILGFFYFGRDVEAAMRQRLGSGE